MPVYAGRVPAMAAERLRRFRGDNTPAVVVAGNGNRHYDDAVLELHDIMTEQGFRTVSAGAFIAQHSIFPKVGKARPDAEDMADIKAFAEKSAELVAKGFGEISLPGNRPYKVPGGCTHHSKSTLFLFLRIGFYIHLFYDSLWINNIYSWNIGRCIQIEDSSIIVSNHIYGIAILAAILL